MALTVKSLDDNGSVHGPEMLELTEDDIAVKFASGLSNLASFSLSISYPSIAAAPCMFNKAYKNVLALSLATDYTYKQAEKVKEFLKDPSQYACSVVSVSSFGDQPLAK